MSAFNALLEADPAAAPHPTAINLAMGRKASLNKLPGRLSKLRIEMLVAAGFVRKRNSSWNSYTWRWVRPWV